MLMTSAVVSPRSKGGSCPHALGHATAGRRCRMPREGGPTNCRAEGGDGEDAFVSLRRRIKPLQAACLVDDLLKFRGHGHDAGSLVANRRITGESDCMF